jgi:hypothetical protein
MLLVTVSVPTNLQSSVAEHRLDLGHLVQTQLHPNNMNSENIFSLSRSLKPLIHCMKRSKNIPRTKLLLPHQMTLLCQNPAKMADF